MTQAEAMLAAAVFAHAIGYPPNLSIDINWSRTWVGDDPDGRILGRLMELSRKWLKPRYCKVFAQIAVRENPDGCPNTHILVHCPPKVLRGFKEQVRNVLDEACHGLNERAVKFKRVGNGNSTLPATLGKLAYMRKGMDPRNAKEFGISCEPQGWTTASGHRSRRTSTTQPANAMQKMRKAKSPMTFYRSELQLQPCLQGMQVANHRLTDRIHIYFSPGRPQFGGNATFFDK